MARLLLPLLLLCSVHTATASSQDQGCGVHPQPVPATQASQCSARPCTITTNNTVTLALPVQLSLEDPYQAWDGGSPWGMRLHLLDDTGVRRGEMKLKWDEKQSEVVLRGMTCGGMPFTERFLAALQPGGPWLHLQVEAVERNVTLSHLKAKEKVTAMTLTFQDAPPSVVVVLPRTKVGYSVTEAAAAAPAATSRLLLVVINVLVVISVAVSVAMLVLVWGGGGLLLGRWGVPTGATR